MYITLLVTFYQNTKPHSSITVSDIRRFFCSSKHPCWVWDPRNCLSSEHCAAIFTGHFHLGTRFRMNGAVPPLPMYLHDEHRDTFAFTFNRGLHRTSI
jgi:hypothetical protein